MHLLKSSGTALSKLLRAKGSWLKLKNGRYLSEEARDRVRALKPGDKLHGYTVQRIQEVPEFFITAAMLTHDKTGAQHLHAARDDDNNTFSVTFRTTPTDSTGVPHILEHTTLCGSENFPVHDPFFKMLSRSMATFMNALTASDWTMYPFSSQNEQDFRNLMSVYMDAAFFPLLRPLDFCQEGWRLEHADPKDSSSPVVFKGVVYNEMKGVFSNPQSTYMQEALRSLLPSHTYGVVSGGDPAHITSLTYEQLKEFHASHYHPSNAKFFTYGNFPLESHLEFINGSLERFEKITPDTEVPNEPRWDKPRTKRITCPPDPMAADPDKQTTVSVNYLWSDITDPYESFIAAILGHLLVQGESSPFYQALLSSNIGSDYSPGTGYAGVTKEGIFSVGLLNIHAEDEEKVLNIIDETIDKVIEEGFDQTSIDAFLHQLELDQKHQSSNFGFHLTVGLASAWNHEADPVAHMQLTDKVDRFREELKADPSLLQVKVKQLLKDNQHRLTLTMSPDSESLEKKEMEEAARLDTLVAGLDEEDRKDILERGLELLESQTTQEDISCLPSLKVEDLDRKIKPETIEIREADWSIVQTCEQPTNGVNYLRMASNLEGLPEELLPFVPLFCSVITNIGAGGHDYLWMSQQEQLYTGGMTASPIIVPHHTDRSRVQRAVLFSSYCLEKNFYKMMELWTMIVNSPDFSDVSRLSTLIRMVASDLASNLSDSGHQYAIYSASSTLGIAPWLNETLFGYTQVRTMKQIAETEDLSDIIYKLQAIGDVVLDKSSLRLSLNGTPASTERCMHSLKSFLANVKGEAEMTNIFPEIDDIEATPHHTQFELPFSVNYVAKSFPAVLYTHKDFAPLSVLATLMSRKFLHREIREIGGAYGSGASMSPGLFNFYSYRDPHNLSTLEVFSRCADWAREGSFSQEDVQEAKLGVFQKLDKPVTPGNRGQTRFVYDISEDMRQKNRDRLFKVSGEDLKRVAQQYLDEKRPSGQAFLGPANPKLQEDENWTIVREGEEPGAK